VALRVVIADDHPFVLLGIRAALDAARRVSVVGEATCASDLLDILGSTACDVVVTDFSMPNPYCRGDDGLRLIEHMRRDWPELPIVVLTTLATPGILRSLVEAGVLGVINKMESMRELAAAVQAAARGRRYLGNVARESLLSGSRNEPLARPPASLTPRQSEVVQLFSQGLSVTEIARRLSRDIRTISRQKRDAMRKLGVHTDSALFAYARAHGLST
jgi:two-component system capsular synthesis response regulator RcsB